MPSKEEYPQSLEAEVNDIDIDVYDDCGVGHYAWHST